MGNSPPTGRCTATRTALQDLGRADHVCRCCLSPFHWQRGEATHLCPCGHEWQAA